MKTAMILAAGRGERLKPLTELQPKAMCTIKQIPLIEHHVVNLARAGFQSVIINHAYLGGQIRQHLKHGERFGIEIIYSPEPPGGLETRGGIANALSLLGHDPFLTINADVFTNYDLSTLQLPATSLAHLVLVPKPTYITTGDFGLDNDFLINNENKQYTFSGIACYQPALFNMDKPGRASLTPLLRTLATKQQLTGEGHSSIWFDIGSPDRLKIAQESN